MIELTRRRIDVLFLATLLASLVLHLLGGVGARYVRVASIQEMEEDVAQLFRAKLVDLGPAPAVFERSEPTSGDPEDARIEQELQELEALPAPQVDDVFQEMLRDRLPLTGFTDEDRMKLHGAGPATDSPPALITAEESRRTVANAGDALGGGGIETVASGGPIRVQSETSARERRLLGVSADALKIEPPSGVPNLPTALSGVLDAPSGAGMAAPSIETTPPSFSGEPEMGLVAVGGIDGPNVHSDLFGVETDALDQRRRQVVNLDDLLDVRLQTYRPGGEPGYFHISIRPHGLDQRLAVLPKDLIFVLDASRSMGLRTFSFLKEGIKTSLQRLRPEDRFTVIGFRNKVLQYADELVTASPLAISEALEFVDELKPSGRTDIYTSIEPLMRMGTQRARPHLIVLFSDGRPNVGVTDSRNIINRISSSRAPSTTIFAFGAGRLVNTYLLDFLAYRNRGYAMRASDRADIPATILQMVKALEDPVLMRLQADMPNVDVTEVYPKALPDLYSGGTLSLYGRLGEQDRIALRIAGEAFDDTKELAVLLPISSESAGGQEIARNWAYQKMLWLIGQTVLVGETPVLIEEIHRLGATYDIETGYERQLNGR